MQCRNPVLTWLAVWCFVLPVTAADDPTTASTEKDVDNVVVSGRVVDILGKPLASAKLYLAYPTAKDPVPTERASCDVEGRFRFTVKRSELDKSQSEDPLRGAQVVAIADGFAPDWSEPGDLTGELLFRLPKIGPAIQGRIVDLEGRPVAGVSLRIQSVSTTREDNLDAFLKDWGESQPAYAVRRLAKQLPRPTATNLPETAKTDKEGRFELPGFGSERIVVLDLNGASLASEKLYVFPRGASDASAQAQAGSGKWFPVFGSTFEYSAAPEKVVLGEVREKGSGKPLAGIRVNCQRSGSSTDAQGKFRIEGVRKSNQYDLSAQGDRHFLFFRAVADTPGFDPVHVMLSMERGVEFRGRLTDKATGKPVRASVEYFATVDNPHVEDAPNWSSVPTSGYGWNTKDDGSFHVVGLPGAGFLCVRATEDGYAAAEFRGSDQRPLSRIRAVPILSFAPSSFHAVISVNASENDVKSLEHAIELDPGRTVTGTVVGPDGPPLDGAYAYALTALAVHFPAANHQLPTAEFRVVGLRPGSVRQVVFLSPDKKYGNVLEIGPNEPGPVTIRLAPLGALTGRVLDPQGNPLAGVDVIAKDHERVLEVQLAGNSWRHQLFPRTRTDDKGVYRLDQLVPGIKMDLAVVAGQEKLGNVAEGVSAPAGETKDLGDFKREKK